MSMTTGTAVRGVLALSAIAVIGIGCGIPAMTEPSAECGLIAVRSRDGQHAVWSLGG